ncbi:MAG TPA: hypothetical protein VFQ53_39475 [Kofleriaceae bacterium]|nr:hypothetical protein [Kofleriaceae bacterium]
MTQARPPTLCALALVAVTLVVARADDTGLVHRLTVRSEHDTVFFGYALDADGDTVVIGDYNGACTERGPCHGDVRIYGATRDGLVEQARFHGDEDTLGFEVAIDGDRAAASLNRRVRIFERGRDRRWYETATIEMGDCANRSLEAITLAGDYLITLALDRICVWTPKAGTWRLDGDLGTGAIVDGKLAAAGNTIAIAWRDKNQVALYRRGLAGWRRVETIAVERPFGLALQGTTLAVQTNHTIQLFDVARAPRLVATLAPQSEPADWKYGAELALDDRMLVAWSDDGLHVYRRSGERWAAAGVVASPLAGRTWFGARLALTPHWLWVGDPREDPHPTPGGLVYGFERRR